MGFESTHLMRPWITGVMGALAVTCQPKVWSMTSWVVAG